MVALPDFLRKQYPFSPQSFELPCGNNMSYVDVGEGPTVVMLHGNPSWSFYYRNLIKLLQKNYRVIVPDHIGCGLSDKPQKYPYRLKRHIDNVAWETEAWVAENPDHMVHFNGPNFFTAY